MRYWFLIVWLSFKWMFRINLGDKVVFNDDVWRVSNGVCPTTWTLQQQFTRVEAERSKCRKVLSFSNFLHSFRAGYWFYMTNWYDIWKREGIKPWIKSCDIW